MQETKNKRIAYLDVLRVLATFMVIMVHAGDAYLYEASTLTFRTANSLYAVLLRASVPLFIIMSSILLLPIKTDNQTFFKRRFVRVVIPFLFWSIIYVFLPVPNKLAFGGPTNALTDGGMNVYLYNLLMIPLNFTGSNVHFWFIYIILGLYLFMPVISPWLKTASKKALLFYLAAWVATLFFPYLRLVFPQIHGECDWNSFGMLYYFGGYLGYIILGYFLHHYNRLNTIYSIGMGLLLYAAGAGLTYVGFIADQNAFLHKLASHGVEDWKLIEFNISYLAPNVVMMTTGVFIMVQKLHIPETMRKVFAHLSIKSYGIFLVHYILCLWLSALLKDVLMLHPGVEQLVVAVLISIASYGVVRILSYMPYSKYMVG
ncbi:MULTISPECIES: acyltransferase [unclassified Carboxylicivirga]|uniref:acyltransferase n=1 Tax=Carboxylicivirga TaxID=1628153 RepID=UPI003D347E8F